MKKKEITMILFVTMAFVILSVCKNVRITLYNKMDVATINRLIDNNDLAWTRSDDNGIIVDPSWEGVEWSSEDSNKRIIRLDFQVPNTGMKGDADLSGLTALKVLNCESKGLQSLNVSGCAVLEELFCQNNDFETLDVSNCTALKVLDCSYNRLQSLNVKGCTVLKVLKLSGNINYNNIIYNNF